MWDEAKMIFKMRRHGKVFRADMINFRLRHEKMPGGKYSEPISPAFRTLFYICLVEDESDITIFIQYICNIDNSVLYLATKWQG